MRVDKDDHHTMYTELVHTKTYKQAAYIREVIQARDFPRPLHNELHKNTSPVPLLGYYALCRVAGSIQPYYEYVQDGIDDWCYAVEASNQHPKAKPMEKLLGQVAIMTLREQLPYINEGLPRRPKLYIVPNIVQGELG